MIKEFSRKDRRESAPTWLSLVDLFVAFIGPFFVIFLLASLLLGIDAGSTKSLSSSETVFLAAVQQTLQVLAVFLVVRFGLGPVKNIFFSFTWKDIYRGFWVAVAAFVSVNVLAFSVGHLIGLGEQPTNTAIVTETKGSFVLILAVLVAVIGAPFSEELFFRGLFLRVFERISGPFVAIIASSLFFGLLHWPDEENLKAGIILQISIASAGAIFGLAAVRFNRLGPSIVGHMIFNIVGVVVSLS